MARNDTVEDSPIIREDTNSCAEIGGPLETQSPQSQAQVRKEVLHALPSDLLDDGEGHGEGWLASGQADR